MAEQWPKDRPARATGAPVPPARTERGTWTRFAAAVLIGIFALVVPAVAPRIGHTGAVFTDHEETSAEFTVAPTDPATDPAQADPAQPDPGSAVPAPADPPPAP